MAGALIRSPRPGWGVALRSRIALGPTQLSDPHAQVNSDEKELRRAKAASSDQVRRGLQLQSLWTIPTEAVSAQTGRGPQLGNQLSQSLLDVEEKQPVQPERHTFEWLRCRAAHCGAVQNGHPTPRY